MKNWFKSSWTAVRNYFDDQNASSIVRPVMRLVRPIILETDNGSVLMLQREVKDRDGKITPVQMPVVDIDLSKIEESSRQPFMLGVMFGATETLNRLATARYAELNQLRRAKVAARPVALKAPQVRSEDEIMGGSSSLILATNSGAT